MVEDGGIVVLGGLISDSVTRDEQRVPFLGSLDPSAARPWRAVVEGDVRLGCASR
jgi:hypothetical protein